MATPVFFWRGDDADPSWPAPQEHVQTGRSETERAEMAAILTAGAVVESWRGYAACRLCGVTLGSRDLSSHGFVWPEHAEHYVTDHGVWPPGADDLLAAARAATLRASDAEKRQAKDAWLVKFSAETATMKPETAMERMAEGPGDEVE